MNQDALQLRDLVPAEPMIPHPGLPWWAWTLIGLGVAILAGVVVTAWRRKKQSDAGTTPVDRQAAYREAAVAIAACTGLPAPEAATRASGAIRQYLAKVCADPSLYETHEEFIARHQALESFPETTREQVSSLLSRLAALKYDRPDALPAPPDFTEQALATLRQIHQQSAA